MKKSIKKYLLPFGGVLLLGSFFGIGFGSAKTVYRNKIASLESKIHQLNLELKTYKDKNKEDTTKLQSLKSQSEQLQLFVQDLKDLNLSNEDSKDFSSKLIQQKVSNAEYKAFEKQILNLKNNLSKKVSSLNKKLKNILDNNESLTQETRQGITTSLNKIKNLIILLKKTTFKDADSAVNALKSIQKAQNTFINELSNSINWINEQISEQNDEINNFKEQIAKRDQKIKDLVLKLTEQLRFYLKLILQFKNTLKNFDDLKLVEIDREKAEKIKTKVQKTLKLLIEKEAIFTNFLDKMNHSLEQAEANNDYSEIQSYDLNSVNTVFEKIVKEYDLIKTLSISLYTKGNQDKSLRILNLSQQINDLELQRNTFQNQTDNLKNQKTILEKNISEIKENLMSNLTLVLENQINTLSQIKETITNSEDSNTGILEEKLNHQIEILNNLKNQYTADNYSETFIPIVTQALVLAQQVVEKYKSNILLLKEEYQNTLVNLNSTREQLAVTQTEVNNKEEELTITKNNLRNIQTELAQNQNILTTTQERLEATQLQINNLNLKIENRKNDVKNVYDNIKVVYDNLKSKAQNLLSNINSNVDISFLRAELLKTAPSFDESASLEQKQATIKSLINISTLLNNVFVEILQKDYDAKALIKDQIINSLQSQKDQIETQLITLNNKQAQFSAILTTNLTKVIQDYIARKTSANTVVNVAKTWQLSTRTLENLLRQSSLATSAESPEDQINLLKQYAQRIEQITKETVKLQKLIISKSEENYNRSLRTKNNELQSKIDELNSTKSQLSLQNDNLAKLQKKLDDSKNKYQEEINKLQESVRSQLNSRTYQRFNNSLILLSKSYKYSMGGMTWYAPALFKNPINIFISNENIDYAKSIFDLTPMQNQLSTNINSNNKNTLVVKYIDFSDSYKNSSEKISYRVKEQILTYSKIEETKVFKISQNNSSKELFVVYSDGNNLMYKHFLGLKAGLDEIPSYPNKINKINFNSSIQILDVKIISDSQYTSKILGQLWETENLNPIPERKLLKFKLPPFSYFNPERTKNKDEDVPIDIEAIKEIEETIRRR
ncbi:hypothetical protein NPA08_01595 [Mycoplasmopsis citelli]|uniref:hypothetical protein n=1 Tax=Mycoplasmopsis citelli TaxID=171281 RepID=UPI00211447A2|nr:hypothetical protein [Mycoplasmopsis citelli]UUD36510.1 hypothetical protein NPA08_01595 [Mycoplasmopsis citelli]